MVQQKVQLRKIRDFSENISDIFQFLKQELKPLLKAFILVAGVFVLASAILSGLFQREAFSFLDQLQKGISEQRNVYDMYTPGYFISILFSLITYSAASTVVAIYMKLYDEAGGQSPSVADIWRSFGHYFPRAAILYLIQLILVGIGMLLCLAPGIYLLVVFMPYSFIIVNENKSIGQTFNRCLELIKENFWQSLGIYFIAWLIAGVCSLVIGMVLGSIIGVGSYFSTKQLSFAAASATSFITIVEYLFNLLIFISVGLNYYNLAELRDGTGLEKRLEDLGSGLYGGDAAEEQY